MAICIVVLSASGKANQLKESLQNAATPLVRCDLIRPSLQNNENNKEALIDKPSDFTTLTPVEIDTIQLLNPKLSRKSRQRRIAFLLLPFGFLAGFTFSQMTGLTTFSDFGIGALGEPISGGLVGMASGWMGSYVAAASVNSKNSEDITTLRKLSKEGLWLLLLETPFETELPWKLLKEFDPINIFRLVDQ